ncbi:uncharacterized protein E0L32_007444 [Thyridium curvatum]|uniref:Uncharacterized protein n=1 Tax=Thyridium curvatum TaxID=1093900 RepID=A0A507AYT5_9PEZI|nr:uncharacterized protein E0L32_007444 [Thyridium curvatum]TPX11946.1 hypothetical protein E0L32_007444 [Thyridium curvatum]
MSKLDDPAAPPPYTEHPAPSYSSSPADPSLYTSHLAAHLSSLPSRIRAAQSARATEQQVRDLHLITLLVPEVETFLSDGIGVGVSGGFSSSPPPPVAELNLVPAAAVGPGWKLSGAQERRREGETVQLVRVRAPAPSPDGKGSRRSSAEEKKKNGGGGRRGGAEEQEEEEPERDWDAEQFDEWGRWDDAGAGDSSSSGSWWWRDEAMARRLAAHLQPREPVRTERREIAAAVQQIKEEKRSWASWGRKKSDSSSKASSSQPVNATTTTVVETRNNDDGVSMTVRADEVTFRRENEMGIWESMSGWALVVTLRIRRP